MGLSNFWEETVSLRLMILRNHWWICLLGATVAIAAEPPKTAAPAKLEVSSDELYHAGKDLFDTFAPPEIKEQFEYPSKTQWDDFAVRLQRALESNDLSGLAQYESEAQVVLTILRTLPGNEEYIGWLEERLDYIEAAKQTTQQLPPVLTPTPPVPPGTPGQLAQSIPHYELWLQRLRARPKPPGADRLIPMLREIFIAAGLPGELVWLVEVESTFNTQAGSPAGARGLFQLMPATAKELGLSVFMPDERMDPKKSAVAAAELLISLHKKFGDWPLALAAYNAGAGRVRRTLNQQNATTFAEIASALPAETRMYVPKVLAMLQVRAGTTLAGLAPPRS